ncbi:hypothetical protein MRB53_026045 [Persea americana]|uniref:Uncharacterized protein n=1 Tax=Persea americana TaxID=3435 RepID=A0ACC2LH33_PERAE|nr:hypothetical protein MRB53_026045 [Persea americana]
MGGREDEEGEDDDYHLLSNDLPDPERSLSLSLSRPGPFQILAKKAEKAPLDLWLGNTDGSCGWRMLQNHHEPMLMLSDE